MHNYRYYTFFIKACQTELQLKKHIYHHCSALVNTTKLYTLSCAQA